MDDVEREVTYFEFAECKNNRHPDDHWQLNPLCQHEGCGRPRSDWPHNNTSTVMTAAGLNKDWHDFIAPPQPWVWGENAHRMNSCPGFINRLAIPNQQCSCRCHWGTYRVNVYEVDRGYGGPEEGGWWYDSGEPIATVPFDTLREAEAFQTVMAARFPATHKSSSVIYDGGDYRVWIERHFARPFPEQRPHYE